MTDHHTSRFCSSCNRVFYSERDGTFCAACVMLAYEQASFTGTEITPTGDKQLDLSSDDIFARPTQRIERIGASRLDDPPMPVTYDDFWKTMRSIRGDDAGKRDDATPTQRLDTDGVDDGIS